MVNPKEADAGLARQEGYARYCTTSCSWPDLSDEMRTQRSINIIDSHLGGRLVTVIEILSLWNKVYPQGRNEHWQREKDIIVGGANLVEIDFFRTGSTAHYRVCVNRCSSLDGLEYYRISIRDSLPAIRIPLRETDADVILDLQTLIEQVYENGRYDDLDYTKPPIPPLSDNDAVWADQLLREKGLR